MFGKKRHEKLYFNAISKHMLYYTLHVESSIPTMHMSDSIQNKSSFFTIALIIKFD